MAGRPKIFDEQEVIEKATEVFWLKGYEAASATELLLAMDIGKGSFYLAFKEGKKELYARSLEQFSNKALEQFKRDLMNADNPIGFLKEFFLTLADLPMARKTGGCYFGNAIVEMSNIDDQTREKASLLLSKLEENFEHIIRNAQQNHLLKNNASPDVLARHLINLWNGIHITQRMYPADPKTKEMIELNLQILN